MEFNPDDQTVIGLNLNQKVFERYTLDRVLGQGAMGVVWLARDTVMDEAVALKFLPQVLVTDPAALDELKREARQARRLTHENIVRIHDIVTDGKMAAISMEWVDGSTLSEMRLEKPNRILEVSDLLPLIPQMAAGLDYAHQRAKVVHRDLKPSNLMVSSSGDLKITDFGIARSLTDTVTRLTRATTSGTPCYMSPQQMMGDRPSPKDDIYALGATLYELLTGKPPYYTGDIGMQILHAGVESVSDRRNTLGLAGEPIPEEWESVLQRCLSKIPEERPGSLSEVIDLLGLERLQVLEGLAREGNIKQLNREKDALENQATTPEMKGALKEESATLIWNGILAQAQSKLKAGRPHEAYRILHTYEQSGLGGERIDSLKPRMEAIRTEANRDVLQKLDMLEREAENSGGDREMLLARTVELQGQYLPDPAAGETDATLQRLDRMKKRLSEPSSTAIEESDAVPPPLPKAYLKHAAGVKQDEPDMDTVPPLPEKPVAAAVDPDPVNHPVVRKRSTKLVVTLLAAVVFPLLVTVLFLLLYLPFQSGQATLSEIDVMMEQGYFEGAASELDQLSSQVLQSLFLGEAIARRREVLKSDRVLAELYEVYPGLEKSFSAFRDQNPSGGVQEFRGSGDALQDVIDAVDPGTVILLRDMSYEMVESLAIDKSLGLVAGIDGSLFTIKSDEGGPKIRSEGADLLLTGLEIEEDAETPIIDSSIMEISDGRAWLNHISIRVRNSGILFKEAQADIEDAEIIGSEGVGIQATGKSAEVRLRESSIESFTNGILIRSGAGGIIENSRIQGNKVNGVMVAGGGSVILSNAIVRENQIGLSASDPGSRVQITGSRIEVNTEDGIRFISGSTGRVSSSDIQVNGVHGINLSGSRTQMDILENHILENESSGVIITNGAAGMVKGNVVVGNTLTGISAMDLESYAEVDDNEVESNGGHGIYFGSGAGGWAEGNRVIDNIKAGILVSGSGTEARIFRNTVSGNQFGIVVQTGGFAQILENESLENTNSGIGIYLEDTEAIISANILRSNGAYGLDIDINAQTKILQENTYSDNASGDVNK